MSLNGLYNCITQNKGKTEYLVLVAKLQKALNYRNTSKKKKKFKKKTFNQNLIIYMSYLWSERLLEFNIFSKRKER